MKTIWIVNYYASVPSDSTNTRHYEFAKYLVEKGYDVRVFFGDMGWKDNAEQIIPIGKQYCNKDYEGLKYTHIRTMPYVGNGVKRGISIFKFALDIFRYRKHFEKPDVILLNMHAPFDYPIIWCAKKMGSKLISEAWDLWPDGFVRFGLMKASNPVVKLFYQIEKRMYQKGDAVVFSFEGGIDYLRSRGWTTDTGGRIDPAKVYYINNGVNLDVFDNYRKEYPTHDPDLLSEDATKVLYLGSVRLVNQVKDFIDAAELLKDKKNIKFIIIGDGVDRPMLEQYCKEHSIDNVVFKQKQVAYCEVPDIVSHASINIMNYHKDFGIYGVSSGKMCQYFAAGKPICCNIKLNYCEITRNNIGIAEYLDTPQKYADAILKLAGLSAQEKEQMQERCKRVAEIHHLPYLASQLEQVIENL
jgi:glycosyltransferase involved in cell wall biosynthesis